MSATQMSANRATLPIAHGPGAQDDEPQRDRTVLAWLVALLALALGELNPSITIDQARHRHLLVFDITQSMNVRDQGVGEGLSTRLESARQFALEAVARMRCGSEVGLGLFTGHRTLVLFTPVEVCEHYTDIAATMRAIDWRMAWEARSEVAKGLHSALISAAGLAGETSVVFITDGHEAPPINPGLRPRYRGTVGEVRGAIAGIGGDVPVPIPKLDSTGKQRGFWQPDDVMQVDRVSLGNRGSSVSGASLTQAERAALQQRIARGTEHLSSIKEDYLRSLSSGLQLVYTRTQSADSLREVMEHTDLARYEAAAYPLRHALAVIALALLLATYLRRGT